MKGYSINIKTDLRKENVSNIKKKKEETRRISIVLYVSETLSLTLREERRLRMFENKAMRKIFIIKGK